MQSIWVAIQPKASGTRILAEAGPAETLVKAHLASEPSSPHALPALLEGLALWQGAPIRAALCVEPSRDGCGMSLLADSFADVGRPPLYELRIVSGDRRRKRRDRLPGMGSFRDLRQLLLWEVAK